MPSRKYLYLERAFLTVLCAAITLRESPHHWRGLFHVAFVVVAILLITVHHRRQALLFAYAAVVAEITSVTVDSPWLQQWLRIFSGGGALLGILGSVVFPLPDFTVLHGPFQTIACYTTHLGEVDCRVYYPSAREESSLDAKHRVPYAHVHHGESLKRGLSIVGKAPQWFFNSAFLSAISATDSAARWTSTRRFFRRSQSQGTVVVVVNHCDGSACVTRHEDGSIHLIQPVPPEVGANTNGEGFRVRNQQLVQRVREVRGVLDAISHSKTLASKHPVYSTIDLSNVHVAGHSFGAATALSAAHEDDRFRSAILHDAFMMPVSPAHKSGLGDRVPVLHLISEQFLLHRQENVEVIKRHARGCSHSQTSVFVLKRSHHNDFTDLPQFSPLVAWLVGAAWEVDLAHAAKALGQLSAAFVRGEFANELRQFPLTIVPVM